MRLLQLGIEIYIHLEKILLNGQHVSYLPIRCISHFLPQASTIRERVLQIIGSPRQNDSAKDYQLSISYINRKFC